MYDGLVGPRECGDFGARLMARQKSDGLWLDQLAGDSQCVSVFEGRESLGMQILHRRIGLMHSVKV